MHVFLRLLLVALLACGGTAVADRSRPEAASGFSPKPAVRDQDALAVTANPHATAAAIEVLRAGGSALDAAVSAVLVLNVVEPQSSGIGGGAFLLHFDRTADAVVAWDGRETAPAAVGEELFMEAGRPLAFFDAVVGGRAVGAPGLLRMLEAAHAEHGRLPWARLIEPAIALAEDGFAVSPRLHALLAGDRFLREDAAARALFYDAAGDPLAVGARLRNPALAQVLRRVAQDGADALHTGTIARDIVAAVRRAPRPGLLSLDDLRDYQPLRRAPLCGAYRAYRVCGMPPPSAGGGTVLAMLGILERFRLGALDPDSAFVTHLFAEAGRLAFADREAWYGDPSAMTLSAAALTHPDYLRERAQRISLSGSMGRAEAGRPDVSAVPAAALATERPSTTHVSIIDGDGNAVSLTASVEHAFGSRRMVHGFLLNNQLTDFSFVPHDSHGVPHPNRAGPGKRPRSSMAPTLVFDPDGQLFAVTGSPGGSQIIHYVVASVIGLVDWGMAPDTLIARPHAGSRNGPTEVEDNRAGRALATRLEAFGHDPVLRDFTSGLAIIVRDGDAWTGAADPRREGVAAGLIRP